MSLKANPYLPETPPSSREPERQERNPGFPQPTGRGLQPYSSTQLWLRRVGVLLLVFFCAVVGVLLVIMPWRQEWTDNGLLLGWPVLRTFVSNNFVRGLCSGLGVLDIGIGFWEAVHYHEVKRG